jgi:predicted esterase
LDAEDAAPDTPPAYAGSAGCQGGAGIPEGENTFTLDGLERRFVMRLPSNYTTDRPWPLIFALHGNGGTPSYWDTQGGSRDIRAEVDEEAIVIVAAAIDRQWRDYSMDRDLWPERIEQELRYFDHLIEESKEKLCVDERAIFAMGFSGGGSFSGVLGCRREDIRAIAVGGSVLYFEPDECVGTPAAWITIGAGELAPAREQYRDFFRDRAGCQASRVAAAPSPCEAYEGCGEGTPVHYCQHPDGHVWPGFGTPAAWAFFSQFVEAP